MACVAGTLKPRSVPETRVNADLAGAWLVRAALGHSHFLTGAHATQAN